MWMYIKILWNHTTLELFFPYLNLRDKVGFNVEGNVVNINEQR